MLFPSLKINISILSVNLNQVIFLTDCLKSLFAVEDPFPLSESRSSTLFHFLSSFDL
jgi:hypothetical protein